MRQHTEPLSLQESASQVLTEARARTLLLISPLSDEDLQVQHNTLMSPIVWDLGHIAHFEELWLLRNLRGKVEFGEMPGMYNPFENPRSTRAGLPLPPIPQALREMAEVRRRVLDGLGMLPTDSDDPLLREGYVVSMVAQHEYQHNETILQTLQLKGGEPYRAPRAMLPPSGAPVPSEREGMVRFPGGNVPIGTDDRSAAYDNERPRHTVELAPFWIDAAPVSNGEFLEFMEAGGYTRREHWSEEGWIWLQEAGVNAPMRWRREDANGGEWRERFMDREMALDPNRPVCHVCYHEAEAYARWAGKRLPTEWEWEAAAAYDPESGGSRVYPWGDDPPTALDANLDQLTFETAPIGAYARNLSPIGCYGMIGDVWEWTSSDFQPYPGYQTFPYKEYSEAFFGSDSKILRGGSWATRPAAIRNTFRNWDFPIRRQIFSGFRCARDA